MIRVADLCKQYAGAALPSLRGVSFEVEAGRLAAILGPSGSGKSTLLRCLVGLEPFDAGSITVDQTVVRGRREHASSGAHRLALESLRGRTGLVFQSFELFPHLTVLENCTLAPKKVNGIGREQAEANALRLLGQLGLEERARAYPEHLSGGQRQRVAIARALAMEPQVLLYDEPTSALDPSLKREVMETLARVSETGVTQIVVTHDVALARETADIVFVLDEGRLAESGRAAQVIDFPTAEATHRLLRANPR